MSRLTDQQVELIARELAGRLGRGAPPASSAG